MSASLAELLQKCLDTEQGYSRYAEPIATYVHDTSKNIKLLMPIVNVVKQTIKSKTHTSGQKLLALRLLNKCFIGGRQDFNRYVEKKILERLGIFAMHNKEKTEEIDLMFKGEFMFTASEKDRRSAATFFVLLLDCMEKWSKLMPLSEEAGKGPSQFAKTYQSLLQKGVFFPSQCRQGNPLFEFGLNEEAQQLQGGASKTQSRSKTEYKQNSGGGGGTQPGPPKTKMDAQKIASDLKDRMMKAKSASKKSEVFLAKMQTNNFNLEGGAMECIEIEEVLKIGREQCEYCVQALMSEDIGPIIANKEDLLDRMLKYQEQILTASAIIQPIIDNFKQQEAQAYSSFKKPSGSSKNKFTTAVPSSQRKTESGATKGVGVPNTIDFLSSLFPSSAGSKTQVPTSSDDPFAEAVMELQKNPQPNSKVDDIFASYNTSPPQQQTAHQHQQKGGSDFNFDFPSQQQPHVIPPSGHYQNEQVVDEEAINVGQSPQDQYEEEKQHQYEKVSVGGADNYSVFKMMQEGVLDLDKEKAVAKKKKELAQKQKEQALQAQQYQQQQQQQQEQPQQQESYYQNHDQQQQHYNNQEQPSSYQPEPAIDDYYSQQQRIWGQSSQQPDAQQQSYSYAQGAGQNGYSGNQNNGGDEWSSRKIQELEKQVKSLKQQNTDMITQNQILKTRVENLKEQSNANASGGGSSSNEQHYQLQNQQLEMQLQNMREYYDREFENKDHQLKLKDQEIQLQQEEIEALRGGESPSKVQRASEVLKGYNQTTTPVTQKPLGNGIQFDGQSPASSSFTHDAVQEVGGSPTQENKEAEDDSSLGDLYEPKTDEFDRKTDSLYLKGIIADKMLVFDDPNVRIGCIRSVSNEWRQATLKLYIGSKSQTEGISGIKFTKDIQYMSIKNEDNQPFEVEPNDQIEVQIYVGAQVLTQPYVFFQYGENQSPVKLKLPVNLIFFCEPFAITAPQFLQFWKFSKNHASMRFNMDLARISNLQAIKKILTLNEKHGAFIQGIDAKPNIVGYSANHLEGQVFAILEISASGKGSVLQVKSDVSMEFSQKLLECFLDMLAARPSQKVKE